MERFERHAPASVMARLALEHALPAGWVDEVFEAHRQQQYSRELLVSTAVGLTMLVLLGLRPSLHAAARQMPALPGLLYDKVNHTEPAVLRSRVAWRKRVGAVAPAPLVGQATRTGIGRPGSSMRLSVRTATFTSVARADPCVSAARHRSPA